MNIKKTMSVFDSIDDLIVSLHADVVAAVSGFNKAKGNLKVIKDEIGDLDLVEAEELLNKMFDIGASVATVFGKQLAPQGGTSKIGIKKIKKALEKIIDLLESLEKALEDKKLSLLEGFGIGRKVIGLIQKDTFKNIKVEIKDLDISEIKELLSMMVMIFGIVQSIFRNYK